MKKILTVFCSLSFIFAEAQSLSDTLVFIANFYTGQSSNLSGAYSKKTGNGERGSVTFNSSNNLRYVISPADFQIQPNEEKSWVGYLTPDISAIPLPGTSEEGWFSGNYNITYNAINPEDPYGDPIATNVSGTQTIPCRIYSMNVSFSCPEIIDLFPGQSLSVSANPYPAGGTITWSNASGLNVSGDLNGNNIQISPLAGNQNASILITYELSGITITKTLQVNVLQPVFPETILIDSGVVLFDLFPNGDDYSFTFNKSNDNFFLQSSGNDAVLISTNQAVTAITEDPFASGNAFYQINQQLGFNYPNLSALIPGQEENAPLPPFIPTQVEDQQATMPQETTPNGLNSFIMGNTSVSLMPDGSFSRPIQIALKSNPTTILGTITISLVH